VAWNADSQSPAPAWVQRHLRGCSDCRQFEHRERQLIASLIAETPSPSAEPSPFLTSRIVAELSRTSEPPRLPILYWVRAAAIPAFGVLLIGAYLSWQNDDVQAPPTVSVGPVSGGEAEPTLPSVSRGQSDQILAWAENFPQPLESELNLVVDDAKAALRLVAENFLPDTLLARNEF
jgi:hypothetical protein